MVFFFVYVDNVLLTSVNSVFLKHFITRLGTKFTIMILAFLIISL